jgi:hypothetical protein
MLVKNSPLRGGHAREKICVRGSLARENQHAWYVVQSKVPGQTAEQTLVEFSLRTRPFGPDQLNDTFRQLLERLPEMAEASIRSSLSLAVPPKKV